jgi:glycosyltransferase involved in cell wall biosynthesis
VQAHNGLARWLDNFAHVTVCAPLMPEHAADATMQWRDASDLVAGGRLTLQPLPWGYHPREHFRHRAAVRALFRALIPQHRFLCFSNLGWLGAWGNIAADEAAQAGRDYAVWLDWVLHAMPPEQPESLPRRAFGVLHHALLKRRSLRAVRRASLGLFHGQSVHEAYAPLSRNPQLVHDIHLKAEDLIDGMRLAERLARVDGTVRIGYVGRVHPMKGPLQWIDAVQRAIEAAGPATRIQATWLGDGPLLDEARRVVAERGLASQISFPGAETSRPKVLEFLRGLDLFVFCHLTPESPRCLIEALMAGLPLLGYASPYAADLVAAHGGGAFVPIGDAEGLSQRVLQHAADRRLRARQAYQAHASGSGFSDASVFRHRSELIKAHTA